MERVVYLGFNGFNDHKRGVENVIEFQASLLNDYAYYFHWGKILRVYRYKCLICISLPSHSIWKFVYLSLIIKKLIKQQYGKVIIHSHNTLMSIFLYRKTDLLTVHDGLYYQKKSLGIKWGMRMVFYILEKILYTRSRRVHFISEYTKSQSLFPCRKQNYSIVYNSSNYEYQLSNFTNDVNKFDELFPFLSGKKFCFLVRSIEERARIDLIIDVAKLRSDLMFVVAGKGPLLTSLQESVVKDNLSNVFLLGFVDDNSLFMLYSFADFVVVPAEYGEGFGLPIIEGYLFNKPVIASCKCAIPEIIIHKSYLFENNITSLLNAISNVETIERENYKLYYMNHFSQAAVRVKYIELYNQCIHSQ